MFGLAEIQGKLSPVFQPYAAFITQIANICAAAEPELKDAIRTLCLYDADHAAQKVGPTPRAFREAFIEQCESWGASAAVAAQIRQIPLPMVVAAPPVAAIPAVPVDYRARHADDLKRLKRLRTAAAAQRG
jgi:hypothetical protein